MENQKSVYESMQFTAWSQNIELQADIFIKVHNLLIKEVPSREELEKIAIKYVMSNPDLQGWTVAQVEIFLKRLQTGITTSMSAGKKVA